MFFVDVVFRSLPGKHMSIRVVTLRTSLGQECFFACRVVHQNSRETTSWCSKPFSGLYLGDKRGTGHIKNSLACFEEGRGGHMSNRWYCFGPWCYAEAREAHIP